MFAFFSIVTAETQDRERKVPVFEQQYAQVLDAFFEHARGTAETAVVLRIWGGLGPEYEIVLDPETAPRSLTIWTAAKPIWGNAFSLSSPRPTTDESIALAQKIHISKKEVPAPEEQVRELWRRAFTVETSASEHGPFRDSKGREVVILDAPYLEMISDGGRKRVRVEDTGDFKDVTSHNPVLLHWALDLIAISKSESRSSGVH